VPGRYRVLSIQPNASIDERRLVSSRVWRWPELHPSAVSFFPTTDLAPFGLNWIRSRRHVQVSQSDVEIPNRLQIRPTPALSAHAARANRGRIIVIFVPSPGSLSRPSRTRQNCYSATAFLMPCQTRSFKAISGGGGSISGGSVRLRPSTTRFATSISPSV
jgi:hypothetical protein